MEEQDLEEKKNNDGSIVRMIKSTAIVKFEQPYGFVKLKVNTNLNNAPKNWLLSRSKIENHLCQVSLGKDKPFASFNMANCHPDLTGDVDVIADAENVKNLLKMPYDNSQVSMMVHRIDSSLLIDSFDVHKYLLRTQQHDWDWLRKFYQKTVLSGLQDQCKDFMVIKKNKSKDVHQQRNMFSKFLYHSIAPVEPGKSEKTLQNFVPLAPDIKTDDYHRNVVWNFEDMQLLVGTDLPIFGGDTHPCVSLRLNEYGKPINVLTGIDYWLDNLMCNVPELAMCFHLNGIVQTYELIKTEDIPKLESSKFSPKVVCDIAQNILTFLRRNATKEGHTYWLFKGHCHDVVKLYDLTSLCSEIEEDRSMNPFTIHVAILLYRVARNMRSRPGRVKGSIIKKLLQKCLLLLDKEKYPQVVTSAHLMLSELYISGKFFIEDDDIKQKEEQSAEFEETPSPPSESEENDAQESEVCVEDLSTPQSAKQANQASTVEVMGSVKERCERALQHAYEALVCLEMDLKCCSSKKHQVDDQVFANPSVKIPLHYTAVPSHLDEVAVPESDSWHLRSKVILLRKLILAFYGLADEAKGSGQFGTCLRNAELGLLVADTMEILVPEQMSDLNIWMYSLYEVYANTCTLMGDFWGSNCQQYQHQYEDQSEIEQYIVEVCRSISSCQRILHVLQSFPKEDHQSLSMAAEGYNRAIWKLKKVCRCKRSAGEQASSKQASSEQASGEQAAGEQASGSGDDDVGCSCPCREKFVRILRRLGNCQNLQGSQLQQRIIQNTRCSSDAELPVEEVWMDYAKVSQFYGQSLSNFVKAQDVDNQVLLLCNHSQMFQVEAQIHYQIGSGPSVIKQAFQKAIDFYQKALSKSSEHFCKSIRWDISNLYFKMACWMQDSTDDSSLEGEKQVTELMNKALEFCDTKDDSTRLYRFATIHHRLASLYHKVFRQESTGEIRRKHLKSLCELHYNRAMSVFDSLSCNPEVMRIILEKFAILEYVYNSCSLSNSSKLGVLQQGLVLLLSIDSNVQRLISNLIEGPHLLQGYRDEIFKLLNFTCKHLHFTLQNLIKCCRSAKKESERLKDANFKKMYHIALTTSLNDEDLLRVCQTMHLLLTQIGALSAQ